MANETFTIDLTSHKDEVIQAATQQILLGLEAIGEKGEGYAKEECPVKTGVLRASIGHKPVQSELAVYIGTNKEYAPYVEYNDQAHHTTGKAHFLRDAAANHADEYRETMLAALKT